MTSMSPDPLENPSDPAQTDSGVRPTHGTGAGQSALEEPGMGDADYVDEGVLPEPDTNR